MVEEEPPYSVAGLWREPWDGQAFKRWALRLRRALLPREVNLGLVFIGPQAGDEAEEIVDILRNALGVPTLGGCVAGGAVVNGEEFERHEGVAVGLFCLPGARIQDLAFSGSMANDAARAKVDGPWRRHFEPGAESITSWLAFAEPMSFGVEDWLASWQRDFPETPVFGGLSYFQPPSTVGAIICNDQILGSGGAVFGFAGGVALRGLVAQGCAPVGESWTITKASGNVLERIGNRPAYQILEDTFREMTEEDRHRSGGMIFVGLAVDEYQESFGSGDFVVRNLLAADSRKGSLVVGAHPRAGRTVQFQIRDGGLASMEMRDRLEEAAQAIAGKRVFGAAMSNCAGRGSRLFGERNHDARMVSRLLNGQAMVGFFGNGEFGPVRRTNFVHGYTCSLAVFTEA